MTTIGLGSPAYLDALVNVAIPASDIGGVNWMLTKQPSGSKAELQDSPMGPEVPSYEPSDRVSSQVAGRKMLRPDVPGRYLVTASITVSGIGTTDVSLLITAGTYKGINACAGCHNIGPTNTPWSMVSSWSRTSHSHIFKDGMNGVASDHYGQNCLGCHTVGYDANNQVPNGGFTAVAAQLKWTFPTTLKMGTYDALPDALKNVGNIQCENCHGPGSQHIAYGGDTSMISTSLDSGTCGVCHGAKNNHVKSAEWANSRHAAVTTDPSGAGREGCVGCHTAAGFIQRVKGVTITNTAYNPVNCQTCHEPHSRTKPDNAVNLLRTVDSVQLMDGTVLTEGGKGMICMNCHMSRRNAADYVAATAGSARFGPHYGTQTDMLMGTNGYTYGRSIPSSSHGLIVEDTCVGCHMQAVAAADKAFTKAGGHTFKPSGGEGLDLVKECQKCHGPRLTAFNFPLFDYNDDGVTDGVQTEVQKMLDQVALMLPPVGQPKTSLTIDATWTKPQLAAAYNWQFVKNDGSMGIHNMAYTIGLLDASLADLKANQKK